MIFSFSSFEYLTVRNDNSSSWIRCFSLFVRYLLLRWWNGEIDFWYSLSNSEKTVWEFSSFDIFDQSVGSFDGIVLTINRNSSMLNYFHSIVIVSDVYQVYMQSQLIVPKHRLYRNSQICLSDFVAWLNHYKSRVYIAEVFLEVAENCAMMKINVHVFAVFFDKVFDEDNDRRNDEVLSWKIYLEYVDIRWKVVHKLASEMTKREYVRC